MCLVFVPFSTAGEGPPAGAPHVPGTCERLSGRSTSRTGWVSSADGEGPPPADWVPARPLPEDLRLCVTKLRARCELRGARALIPVGEVCVARMRLRVSSRAPAVADLSPLFSTIEVADGMGGN